MPCYAARQTRPCCHARPPWVGTRPLEWPSSSGRRPEMEPAQALEAIRHTAAIAGTDMLGAVQGDRMVVVLGGEPVNAPERAVEIVSKFVTLVRSGRGHRRTAG